MCILCDDCVEFFKHNVDFVIGTFNFISKFSIDGMCTMTFASTTKTTSGPQ